MNIFTKQKQSHGHIEQICGCQEGGGWGKEGLGVWDQQMQTIIYSMETKPCVPYGNKALTYRTGNYSQYPMVNHNGKSCENIYIQILPVEISITSDMQMTPPLWQKVKRN